MPSMVVLTAFKFPTLPLSDESFYLIFQGSKVIGIVPIFSMKMEILGHVPLRWRAFDPLWCGQYSPRVDLHQNFR